MFKSKDEREARAVERVENAAAKSTPKALRALRRRRMWVINQLARDGVGLTGGVMNSEVDRHAQALFFIDQAITGLVADPQEEAEGAAS